jgi:hypothetical protein
MSRIWRPERGMRVRLTDEGLRQIGGLRSNEEVHAQVQGVPIVEVSRAGTTPECWNVDLAGPFDAYLLTSPDVELMK